MIKRIITFLISFCFIFEQTGFAQLAIPMGVPGYLSSLAPVADKFRPIHLRSIDLIPATGNFELVLDKGDVKEINPGQAGESAKKLFEYFQIGLALPNKYFWVNLRPDSPDDLIEPLLAKTDLGKVMLEADLQLKKDLANSTSPQTPEGQLYWNKLYAKARELYNQQDIEIPTLTRPWIVPGEVVIRASETGAFVYKATLKVMLEQDYLKDSPAYNFSDPRLKELNSYSSQLIRELIIPKLTREVNSSKRYAQLRQVYYSLILAQWFKSKSQIKNIDSLDLSKLTSKTRWSKDAYYQAYRNSFQKGEYNRQEQISSVSGLSVRQYFSGGIIMMDKPVAEWTVIPSGVSEFFVANQEFFARLSIDPQSGDVAKLLLGPVLTDGGNIPGKNNEFKAESWLDMVKIKWYERQLKNDPQVFAKLAEINTRGAALMIVDQLRWSDSKIKEVAWEALKKMGVPAVELLTSVLKDKRVSYFQRFEVARALAHVDKSRAIEELLAVFSDEEEVYDLRHDVNYLLGRIGKGEPRVVQTLIGRMISGYVRDRDDWLANDASRALADLGEDAAGAVIAAFQDSAQPLIVREKMSKTLYFMLVDRSSEEYKPALFLEKPLTEALNSPDPFVRWDACELVSYAYYWKVNTIGSLTVLLSDPIPRVRESAQAFLKQIVRREVDLPTARFIVDSAGSFSGLAKELQAAGVDSARISPVIVSLAKKEASVEELERLSAAAGSLKEKNLGPLQLVATLRLMISDTFTADEFKRYEPAIIELGAAAGDVIEPLFEEGLANVKNLINSEDDLRHIGNDLIRLGKASGAQIRNMYGLAMRSFIIGFDPEKAKQYWTDLIDQAIAAGEKGMNVLTYGFIPMQKHIRSKEDVARIGKDLRGMFLLLEGVEEQTGRALDNLEQFLEKYPSAWNKLVKPTIFSQAQGAFLCLKEIRYLYNRGAIQSVSDIEFLNDLIQSQGIRAYDFLVNFLDKGISKKVISMPISNEKERLSQYLKEIPYYVVELYQAYKESPEKLKELKIKAQDIHEKIIAGDASSVENDPLFGPMLYYVFPPSVTAENSLYLNIYRQRPDRKKDTDKIPAALRDRYSTEISTGRYILKDPAKPLDETPWGTILSVVSEVNQEASVFMNQDEIVGLGKQIMENWQAGELVKNRRELLKGLYRYFRYSRNSVLPASLGSINNIMALKEFVGDTLRDMVSDCAEQYKKSKPEDYDKIIKSRFSTKIENPHKVAGAIAAINSQFKDKPETAKGKISFLLDIQDPAVMDSIWEKVREKTAKGEIEGILEEVTLAIQPGKEIFEITASLQGKEYKVMQGEVSAKYSFNEAQGKLKLRFVVSKRKAYGVAGLNMGVCVAPDQKLWDDPNFMNVIIFDENNIAQGGMHLFIVNDQGNKYLVLPGINPSASLLTKVNSEDIYNKLIEYAKALAKPLGCQEVLIPVQEGIHSNRSEMQRIIPARSYARLTLGAIHQFSYDPYKYSLQDCYIVGVVNRDGGIKQRDGGAKEQGLEVFAQNKAISVNSAGESLSRVIKSVRKTDPSGTLVVIISGLISAGKTEVKDKFTEVLKAQDERVVFLDSERFLIPRDKRDLTLSYPWQKFDVDEHNDVLASLKRGLPVFVRFTDRNTRKHVELTLAEREKCASLSREVITYGLRRLTRVHEEEIIHKFSQLLSKAASSLWFDPENGELFERIVPQGETFIVISDVALIVPYHQKRFDYSCFVWRPTQERRAGFMKEWERKEQYAGIYGTENEIDSYFNDLGKDDAVLFQGIINADVIARPAPTDTEPVAAAGKEQRDGGVVKSGRNWAADRTDAVAVLEGRFAVSSPGEIRNFKTYDLYECVCMTFRDPRTGVAGMAHLTVFQNIGSSVKAMLRESAARGVASPADLEVWLIGPGQDLRDQEGWRLLGDIRKALQKNGVRPAQEDIEGSESRSILFDADTGQHWDMSEINPKDYNTATEIPFEEHLMIQGKAAPLQEVRAQGDGGAGVLKIPPSAYNTATMDNLERIVQEKRWLSGAGNQVLSGYREIGNRIQRLGGLDGQEFNLGQTLVSFAGGIDVFLFGLNRQPGGIKDLLVIDKRPFGGVEDIYRPNYASVLERYYKIGSDSGEVLLKAPIAGNIALERIMLGLGGEIKGVYYFKINPAGDLEFSEENQSSEVQVNSNAVIEFVDPKDQSETKRFWYVQQSISEDSPGFLRFISGLSFDTLVIKSAYDLFSSDSKLFDRQKAIEKILGPARKNSALVITDSDEFSKVRYPIWALKPNSLDLNGIIFGLSNEILHFGRAELLISDKPEDKKDGGNKQLLPVLKNRVTWNEDFALPEKLKKIIQETASWSRLPKEGKGRAGIIRLGKPFRCKVNGETVLIKAVKIKGMGDFNDVNNPQQPRPEYYARQFHYMPFVDDAGHLTSIDVDATPIGGLGYQRAVNEFNKLNKVLEKGGVSANIPLGYGKYEGFEFRGDAMGFVIEGLVDPQDARFDEVLNDFKLVTDNVLKTYTLILGGLLRERLGKKTGERLSPVELADYVSGAYKKWGQALRRLNDSGILHLRTHSNNWGMDIRGNAVVNDFDSSVYASEFKPDVAFMLQLYSEVASAIRDVHADVSHFPAILLAVDAGCNPYRSFLEGYFGKEFYESQADLQIISSEFIKLDKATRESYSFYRFQVMQIAALYLLEPLSKTLGITPPYTRQAFIKELERYEQQVRVESSQEYPANGQKNLGLKKPPAQDGGQGAGEISIRDDEEINQATEFLKAQGYSSMQIAGWLAGGRSKLLEIAEAAGFQSSPGDGAKPQRDGGKAAPGGIDFRELPVSGKPTGLPAFMPQLQQLAANSKMQDLDQEWSQIRGEMLAPEMPYSRIKEYIAVCLSRPDCRKKLDQAVSCIIDILRMEEDQALATNPELKDILLYLS